MKKLELLAAAGIIAISFVLIAIDRSIGYPILIVAFNAFLYILPNPETQKARRVVGGTLSAIAILAIWWLKGVAIGLVTSWWLCYILWMYEFIVDKNLKPGAMFSLKQANVFIMSCGAWVTMQYAFYGTNYTRNEMFTAGAVMLLLLVLTQLLMLWPTWVRKHQLANA